MEKKTMQFLGRNKGIATVIFEKEQGQCHGHDEQTLEQKEV
jgi:hypothetical protein